MSRKRQTMEVSYKNNIKILMLILLWLLADLVLQQIHSCEFFIIEFSEGLNSYDCISISVLQSFVIHVIFYSGLLLSTCSLVQDNTCTSSIQCLMVKCNKKKYHFNSQGFCELGNPSLLLHVSFQKCLYQVRVITVFTVFRLLTDFVCLYSYEF